MRDPRKYGDDYDEDDSCYEDCRYWGPGLYSDDDDSDDDYSDDYDSDHDWEMDYDY